VGSLLLLVFALAMCWFSALIGVLMRSPQAVQGFGYLLMFPIVFGSNLLVPTSTMPGWLLPPPHMTSGQSATAQAKGSKSALIERTRPTPHAP
jgi:oleandomycin transport system permease protein